MATQHSVVVDVYCFTHDGKNTMVPYLNTQSPVKEYTITMESLLRVLVERQGVLVFNHATGNIITEANIRDYFPTTAPGYGNGVLSQLMPGANGCPIYIDKLGPMEYCIEYDTLDYDFAYQFFKSRFNEIEPVFASTYRKKFGACTGVCSDGFFGRNYDWYYDNSATLVCKTHASKGRNAVIGVTATVSGSGMDFTDASVDSRIYDEKYKILPFFLLDGINRDTGLVCEINILQAGEEINGHIAKTTGTTPTVELRDSVCTLMLVRYILDHFSSVQDVIENLPKYTSVYSTYSDRLAGEYHYLLSDPTGAVYVLEFIPDAETGEMKMEFINVASRPISTNFHIYGSELNGDNHIDYTTLTTYAMGIERYNAALDYLNDHAIEDVDDMFTLMNTVLKYTNAYTNDFDDAWLTEFTGRYEIEGIQYDVTAATAMTDRESLRGLYDYEVQLFENRSRDIPNTWQTVHTSVYDITNRTLTVAVQESSETKTFKYKCPFEV